MTHPTPSLPLSGIRVADFSRVVAGPYCSMLLADLGADVVKVERPHTGDDTRAWGPPYAAGESAYYLSLNRNKRSLTLDLKDADDLALAHRLVARSDVLLHNFKVGAADTLGLGYEAMRTLNPHLVYAHISGYGSTGPDAARPGYDLLAQAESGLMSITGSAAGEPTKVGVAIVDVLAGLNAALGIVAALFARGRGGSAGKVETSLLEAGLSSLINVASNYLVGGEVPVRHGNDHPNIVPYGQFYAADGPLVIAAGNDTQFATLARLLNHEVWLSDPRFTGNAARVAHREVLVKAINRVLQERPREVWLERLRAAGVPCAPVATLEEVFISPQVTHRKLVQRCEHPQAGTLSLVANALRFDGAATPLRRHPPLLGEHNAELRADLSTDLSINQGDRCKRRKESS